MPDMLLSTQLARALRLPSSRLPQRAVCLGLRPQSLCRSRTRLQVAQVWFRPLVFVQGPFPTERSAQACEGVLKDADECASANPN